MYLIIPLLNSVLANGLVFE